MSRRTIGYVKLEWVCPNCRTRNPGPQKSCINCGAPQPEKVQFERASEEQLVTDEQSVQAAQAGADFICPYCQTRNSATAKACVKCGGDLVEARRRASGTELQAKSGPREVTCAQCGTLNPVQRSNCSKCGAPLPRQAGVDLSAKAKAQAGAAPAARRTNWWLWGGIGAVALAALCAALLFLFVLPASSVQARVSDVHWQTSVPVEEQREVHHTDEEGSPPGDAYDVSCHTESKQVCEEKVVDQGNGYGQKVEDCNDVDTRYCSYTIKEWQTVQTYTLDGHDYSPVYSQPNLGMGQRLGSQGVDYTVYFDTEKGQKKYSPGDLANFQKYQVGSTWTLELNALGGIVGVKQ